jgi:hypothetical protein
MLMCNVCNQILLPNQKIFKGFDQTLCSERCLKEIYKINIVIDPKLINYNKWQNKKQEKQEKQEKSVLIFTYKNSIVKVKFIKYLLILLMIFYICNKNKLKLNNVI